MHLTSEFHKIKEQEFDSIFTNAPIGMAKASVGGTLLEVNDSFGAFMGYPKTDLVNVPINDFTHNEELSSNINNRRKLVGGRQDHFSMEKRYKHRNGRWITGLLHATIIKDLKGVPSHFIAQIIDLTEQKAIERELRISKDQLFRLQSELESRVYKLLNESDLIKRLHQDIASLDPSSNDLDKNIESLKRLSARATGFTSFPTFLRHHDHNFLKQLNRRYHSLSPNDLKICLLLRMNLSTKEIAVLLGISPESANKARYRLRKKMGLSQDEDLVQLLLNI